MSIEKKTAIITGAGRGVGRATALRFAQAGANVVLFSRTQEHLNATAGQIMPEGLLAEIQLTETENNAAVYRREAADSIDWS